MVATVRNLTSSSATLEYFRHDGGYYVGSKGDAEALHAKREEHREASAWHGSGLAALGLKPGARVSSRAFEKLLQGHVPGTEIRLGRVRHGGHERRPAFDLTFSAPKSVSLAALLPTERHPRGVRSVVRAHDEAVRATLDWVEAAFLETRGWDPETGQRPRVKAPFMAAATFRHVASRNLDPQLHTHAVIANMTRDPEGRWRSVDPVALHRNARLIGSYYRDRLARNLIARGYSIVPAMAGRVPSFDIAGLGRELCDAFSTRRREILAYVEDRGWDGSEAQRQIATLATRGRKAEPLQGMLHTLWRERAEALGFGGVSRSVDGVSLPPAPSALEIVGRTVSRLEERYPVFAERELEALALGHSPGRHSLGEIREAVAWMVRDGHLVEAELRGSDRSYVTDRTLKAERRVIAAMKAGLGAGEALAGPDEVAAHLAGAGLTAGQEEAVRTVLLSRDRVVGVQGWAGKTTMLRHVRELSGECPVVGLAPSAAAARVLERETGMNVRTLQWFLTRCGSAPGDDRAEDRLKQQFGGSVVVLDEASMVAAIARGRVRLVLEDGRRVSLRVEDPQLRHIDYAWSSTVRGAQGSTAEGVIAVLDTSQRALTDQSTFYVEISRARDRAVVLTDNLDELVDVLEANTGERATALDAVGEPIEMDVQALAQRIPQKAPLWTPGEEWAALEARARREGTVAFRTEGYDALMERVRVLAEQPLPAATREILEGLQAYDRACREGDAAAKEFAALLGVHAETRRGLEEAAGAAGCAIAGLEGYGEWRALSARLIANGEALLADLGAQAGDAGGEIRDGLGRLPVLHALDDAHRAFETLRDEVTARAAAEDTIPYYAQGHDALLESARALAVMADLPTHARHAAGEVIAEAEACERRCAEIDALRAEATVLLKERGEMEAALSEVPENQLVPCTEGADYAVWSARCEAAEERWQSMRGEADTWDPHLDRLGEGKAALEADMQELEDLRGHDEAWAALYAMRSEIVEHMRAERTAAFDLPEWDAFADRARALKARPGLPEAADRAAEAVLDYDRRCREVDAFFEGAEAHGARWDALRAEAAHGEKVSIVDLPGYAPLTEAELALHATGERVLAGGGGPHLDRVPDGAERAADAFEQLESHALLDRYVVAMDGLEEAAGGAWATLPDISPDKALDEAQTLANEPALEEEARRRLEAAAEEHEALLAQLAAIGQLLRDMEALDRLEQEFGKSAARFEGLPRSLVPGWEDFRAAHEAFPEAARPPLEDAAFETFRQDRPDLVDGLREAVGIVQDRLAPAASELDLDNAMGGAGHREEAGAWQPDATDFPIECKRDIVAGDIVHFTAQADALPGSLDGEDAREVQVVALIVDRTAGKWEDEDLCTLETLWRSDDGPGGTFAEQLDLLTVGDCARMMREQEEERVSAEVELEEARAVVWEIHLSMSMTM